MTTSFGRTRGALVSLIKGTSEIRLCWRSHKGAANAANGDIRVAPGRLPTIDHMLRDQGYYTAYKGKWHESEFPEGDTTDSMEPFGFSDFQAGGDVYGAPLDGFNKDPLIADEAVGWLQNRAPEIVQSQPWYMAVNFVNPHDIMYFDTDDEEMVQVRGMFPIFSAPTHPSISSGRG